MTESTFISRSELIDPLRREEFDARQVRRWRVTWAGGTSEIVEAHAVQCEVGQDVQTMSFFWIYLGAHRVINLAYVRDIAEIAEEG